MARRRCYGYQTAPDGTLVIDHQEAGVVLCTFEQYKAGKSLGKIAAGFEEQDILPPTGKPKWNREAIDKLLSNGKCANRILLQKTFSTSSIQIKNDGRIDPYFYIDSHEDIISDGLFEAVQEELCNRSKNPDSGLSKTQGFW